MGVLIADENSDLLNKNSWHKSEKPVLKTDEEEEIFGQDIVALLYQNMVKRIY